jgi:LysM repeat protein
MNRLRAGLLLVSAVLWVWTSWLLAEPDPAQLAWLDGQGGVLHWDNIEAAPDWLAGPAPRYSQARGMHLVALQTGESVLIRIPAREQLRLVSAAQALHPGDLEVEWSNGSGLYVQIPLRLSESDGSLVTAAGAAHTAGVMRVTRPARFDASVNVALFRSRHADPVRVVSYRDHVDIPGLRRVRLADRSGTRRYQVLQGGDSATLPVQGATRYRLETRVMFPAIGEASQQAYRIDVVLDGKPWRVFEFEATLDSRSPVAVDGCFTPLGQRVRGYLAIPEGARQLELRSTAPVYLRLQGQPSGGDYLWPGNQPLPHAAPQRGSSRPGSIWDLTTAQLRDVIDSAETAEPPGAQPVLRLLQDNRWRDGGLTGSALARRGLQRYADDAALRQQAELAWSLHTHYRDLLPVTVNVTGAQQFAWFRTPVLHATRDRIVVPETYAATLASQLASGYFLEVPAGSERQHEYLLPERAAASRLRVSILRSSVSVPTRLYLQLDDAPPQELRVTASPALPAKGWQPGRAEAALAVMNHSHGARGQSLTGPFAARQRAAPLLDAGFIELPLSRETQRVRIWRDPEQGVPVRLALQYRGSRHYQLSGAGYQALLQAQGPDAVYSQLRAALARDSQGSAAAGSAAAQDYRAFDLYNQWLPLLRLLHARHDRFAATVQSTRVNASGREQLAAAERRALQETAIAALASGDRVAALEAWSAVWRDTAGKSRDEAALARVSLLEQLGEPYLAEQQLRGLLFNAASEATRTQALEQLLTRYRRAGNEDAVLSVLATVVVRNPKPAYLRELADSLNTLGKTREALQVALVLPAAEQPRRLLLEASYAAGWWSLFEAQLASLRDTPAYHYWAGMQAQAVGNYTQALAHWEQGGAATALLRQQLSAGLDIRTRLADADAGVRRQAVLSWEQWQSRYPGSGNWQSAPQLVTRYAGAEALYNIGQDQSSTAFRATPEVPVTLQVYGPVTLRIAARGLHAQATAGATDDWVKVADGGRHALFPVTDNRPATGLQLSGVARPVPGLAEIFEYRVAPGLHEIHVSPERAPLLLQVAAARPRLPLTVLPPLTAATVQAALQGDLGAAQGRPPLLDGDVVIDVLRQCGTSRLVTAAADPDAEPAEQLPSAGSVTGHTHALYYHTVSSDETLYSIARRHVTSVSELARLNAIAAPYTIRVGQRLRIAPDTAAGLHDRQNLPAPRGAAAWPVEPDTAVHVVKPGDTLYSIARRQATTVSELARLNALAAPYNLRVGQRLDVRVASATAADAVVIRQPVTMPGASTGMNTYMVKRGDTLYSIAAQSGINYQQLAALNALGPPYNIHAGQRLQLGTAAVVRDRDTQALEQMRESLWLAEHDDRQTMAMVAKGEALFQAYPDVPGMQRLLRRLRRAAAWEQVPAVQASAGVRVVEVPPGLPEYPATRIRKALLPALRPGEQLISGYETLVFAVDQPVRTHFNIELTLEELTVAPAVPMQVQVQLDDGPERTLLLTPAQPGQSVTQPVPPGNHLLRMRVNEPVLNQFLRVFIREPGNGSGHPLSTRPGMRSYHVATRDEPVVIELEGPTRLRIDELRDGRTLHRYRNIAAGWQQLRIGAGPNQEEALFRIHRLTARQPAAPLPARQPAWDPLPVPLLAVSDSPAVSAEPLPDDRFSLGGQEDGTWSMTSSLVNRRSLDEDRNENDNGEEFAELRATHRFFDADSHSYFRTDLLTRLHDAGGPTLGLLERIDIRRPDWPFEVAVGGSLYLQRPDAATGTEWAATLRAKLSRQFELTHRLSHRPYLSVFQRWLSLDSNLDSHSERVDQDLFTSYKEDHVRGLGIGDTLSYRPWLDSVWYTSFGLVSNTDLNPFDPDYIGVKLGARQMLGNWQAAAEYGVRRYFQDTDRDSDLERQRMQLAVDWIDWRSAKKGLQGRVQLDWDKTSGEYSGLASITWHWSNARFYRDFRSDELGFRSIRRRRLHEQLFADRAGGRDEQ